MTSDNHDSRRFERSMLLALARGRSTGRYSMEQTATLFERLFAGRTDELFHDIVVNTDPAILAVVAADLFLEHGNQDRLALAGQILSEMDRRVQEATNYVSWRRQEAQIQGEPR